jgi:hypothetical protein
MTSLKASVAAVLAMSATLACVAQAAPSIEERLQQLEAEQAAMKQQLAERDAVIQDLKRELAAQGGSAVAPAAAPAPTAAAPTPGQAGATPATDAAAAPQAEPDRGQRKEPFHPRVQTWGTYDPGDGFVIGRTEYGELDVSAYALARYLNQNDDDGVFTDHFGNERAVDDRNDLWTQRVLVFFKGWLLDPKLVYNIFFWTVNATDQDSLFANIGYQFSKKFSLYVGMAGNPGSRSLLGSHPYWLGHDRVMADEFFRPYFANGLWAIGEVLPGLWYDLMVSNTNSQLGVTAAQLDRKLTAGGSLWWMPTTHEFGPRGAYGDWEWHEELATRFGMGYVQSAEQSFSSSSGTPGNTTLRLADSLNLFETGALAPGVTIANADYRVLSMDAGIKYKGMFLQAEYYQRWLDSFDADGLLPVQEIKDTGFYVQGSFFPIKQKLEVYLATSQIYGDDDAGFGDSSEYLVGTNWYPWPSRDYRLNLQLIDVNRSPVSSTFGYYTGGQEGWTVATAFSVLF